MKNLLNFKKPLLILSVFSLAIIISCSKDEISIDQEINQISKLTYKYHGKTFLAETFENENIDILSNSYQVYDISNQTISLFDSQEKATNYSNSLVDDSIIGTSEIDESNIAKSKEITFCKKPIYSFKVELFQKKDFKGKSILFVVKDINAKKDGKVKLKLPNFWQGKASSLIAKAPKLASTENKKGKCKKTPPTIAAFSKDESGRTRLFRTKIRNKKTKKAVLKLKKLKKLDANNAIDIITVFY